MNPSTDPSPKLNQHPLSAAFPQMTKLELADLTNDIRANGQRYPIVLLEGQIIDGWHRYQACLEVGSVPLVESFPSGMDPVAYVQSMNLQRRSLDRSQRAAAVVACNEWARSGHQPKCDPGSPLATNAAMAQVANVSTRTIERAKVAHSAGLGAAVRDGLLTVKRAASISKLPMEERSEAIRDPRSRVKKCPSSRPRIGDLKRLIEMRDKEVIDLRQRLDEVNEANQRLSLEIDDLRTKCRVWRKAAGISEPDEADNDIAV